MPQKYVKRAVVVQAVQWTGFNVDEVKRLVSNNRAYFQEKPYEKMPDRHLLTIVTRDGAEVAARVGDFIVRDVDGSYFPMRPDAFEQFYDRIE